MAAPPRSSSLLILILSLTTLLLLLPAAHAQSAPAPAPSGPINITGILEKAGQYTQFIRLLTDTQADVQINNQVNNSHDGMTVFAPSDNAFNNLPPGALNNLTDQQHVQLVLYHICPKFYSLDTLQTVSNPVRTQASDQEGRVFGLFFSGAANQVNVSTGIVSAPIYNALRKDFPLAVYQVDRVLLPREFYEAGPPAAAPPANGTRSGGGGGGRASGDGVAPSTGNPAGSGSGKMSVGLGLVAGFWLLCMGILA
ncbi:fasciclin-like arabinogalactan protein 9 [Phtheirospermum japonicum]|uniref:Fasciclin-like arabinogalactan protein 9 n=1 Tax=Phtheirospermum japonicum TaxID=374723 RepID=A0A830DAQ0_9LAMI|nr:fasciclin-like arabinogalactan protein 9 [Phtheirospermum japonicum]